MSLTYYMINDEGQQVEVDKEQQAIERIKFAYEVSQHKGQGDLYVAFSGGKDSTVLADLVKRSGVPYTLNYNITGLDHPELIYHMRRHYPELIWHKQPINTKTGKRWTMWSLIDYNHLPPIRTQRYCCSVLKETGGQGQMCLTGVRSAESVKRANRKTYEIASAKQSERMLFNDNCEERRLFENCQMKRKFVCNPIIDWTDEDVWEYIHKHKIPYCKLYDEGFKRLGCIGCPMSSNQEAEFIRYPRYKALYLKAFNQMLKNMPDTDKSKVNWKTAEDVMSWWLEEDKDDYPLIDEMREEE